MNSKNDKSSFLPKPILPDTITLPLNVNGLTKIDAHPPMGFPIKTKVVKIYAGMIEKEKLSGVEEI